MLQARGLGDAALRPAHRPRRSRSTAHRHCASTSACSPARLIAATAWLRARAARRPALAHRLLRREHRRGGRAGRGRAPPGAASARSSRAAAGPTWPATRSAAVRAPTLLIVGGDDRAVIELNRAALERLPVREASWRSCPAPRTCSRSPARSSRSPTWRADWFAAAPAARAPLQLVHELANQLPPALNHAAGGGRRALGEGAVAPPLASRCRRRQKSGGHAGVRLGATGVGWSTATSMRHSGAPAQRLEDRADDRLVDALERLDLLGASPRWPASSAASTWTITRSYSSSARTAAAPLAVVVGVDVAGRARHLDQLHAHAAPPCRG